LEEDREGITGYTFGIVGRHPATVGKVEVPMDAPAKKVPIHIILYGDEVEWSIGYEELEPRVDRPQQ
jgi:hypothetical protein